MSDADVTTKSKTREIPGAMSSGIGAEVSKEDGAEPQISNLFRHVLAHGPAMARGNWQALRVAADRISENTQRGCSVAANEGLHYAFKAIEAAQAGMAAQIELTATLMAAKSPADVIEATSSHARRQLNFVLDQNRLLWLAIQKSAWLAVDPTRREDPKG